MNAWTLAAGAVALVICGSQLAAAEPDTVRFGQIPSTERGTSSVYLFIAEQNGFFARERIKLERIPIPGGTDKMVAALEADKVDVAQTATPST
jgi:ABC-type nitrate/sulfonate/bicarbonate transport system substrate-binding protein